MIFDEISFPRDDGVVPYSEEGGDGRSQKAPSVTKILYK